MNQTSTAPIKAPPPTHALPSGATLHLSLVSFKKAAALRNALVRALGGSPLQPEEMRATLAGLKSNPASGGALFQRLLSVLASSEVEAAMFVCLEAGLYQPAGSPDRLPVDEALFDHPKHALAARGDMYPMYYRVVEVAVLPFLGTLVSMYSAFKAKNEGVPESASTEAKSAS